MSKLLFICLILKQKKKTIEKGNEKIINKMKKEKWRIGHL